MHGSGLVSVEINPILAIHAFPFAVYNSLGWRCLVIWEHELKELAEEEIVLKIKSFHGRKYAHTTHP